MDTKTMWSMRPPHRPAILRQLDRLAPGTPFAGCLGGLGTGLGTALGAKAAFSERPVIVLIGDGTFNYNPEQTEKVNKRRSLAT